MSGRVRFCIAIAGLALLAVCARAQPAIPAIEGPISGGKRGTPFSASPVSMAAYGYQELEYFISGTAHGFESAPGSQLASGGRWTVVPDGTERAYKTRLMVRRPEAAFLGHYATGLPAREGDPQELPDNLEFGPGGLAMIWADENSREALFESLQRRETYATSGTRLQVRFFAGWDLPQDLCSNPDMVRIAYAHGVPMGGEIA